MNFQKLTFHSDQTGAALITVLAFLLVLTLIGLSAMNTTMLEEKMTGTVYNKQLSFQSAETVLREGENYALNTLNTSTIFGSESGLYDITKPTAANYPVWDWANGNDTNSWYAIPAATAIELTQTGVSDSSNGGFDPTYIIENFTGSPLDVDCGLDASKAVGSECELDVYRITARSQGLNANTMTVLQTTYKVFR